MITLRPQDTVHKAHLLRVLTEIVDNQILSSSLYFKGGTCASMKRNQLVFSFLQASKPTPLSGVLFSQAD